MMELQGGGGETKNIQNYDLICPVPMAERSEARTVFSRLNTEIVGSNPTRGIDVSAFFCVVLSCV
jgi:hypothetical protein